MKIYSYISLLNETGNPYITKDKTYHIDGRKVYRNADEINEFIRNALGIHQCAEEFVYVLCFDNRNHMIGCFETSHGTVNGSYLSPREVYQKALMIGAVNIAITHNHPGNDPTPSEDDIQVTERLIESGKIIGINVLDHIVVARCGYCSLREYYGNIFK